MSKPQLPQIAGYTTEAVLGEGGMATVYLAVQESLSRQVALKVMKPALMVDADSRRRFLSEGRLIAKLTHPNIVTVYDIGASDRFHYFAMTYLQGGTLIEKIGQGLPVERAVYVVKCLAEALGYAQKQGIVHRDFKPGNVLFTDDGAPVLTDFGIEMTVGDETQLASTGMTFGNVGYMSPEQALGNGVDSRSNFYSLGILFWEMLTGSLPYSAQDPITLVLQHANDPIPKLPGSLDRFQPIIDGLMAKKPENRLGSAEELVRLISGIADDDSGARATPVTEPVTEPKADSKEAIVSDPPKRTTVSPSAAPGVEDAIEPAPKRHAGAMGAGLGIAGFAGAAAFIGYSGLLTSPQTPQTPAADPPVASDPSPNGTPPNVSERDAPIHPQRSQPAPAGKTSSIPRVPEEDASSPPKRSEPARVAKADAVSSAPIKSGEGPSQRSEQAPDRVSAEHVGTENRAPDIHRTATQPALAPPVRQEVEQPSIDSLLRLAESQWTAGRLTAPPGDNAFESYRRVLDLDPDHPQAKQKLMTIGRINAADRMFVSAETLLRQGDIGGARRMIETGLTINPDDERLLGLKRALE